MEGRWEGKEQGVRGREPEEGRRKGRNEWEKMRRESEKSGPNSRITQLRMRRWVELRTHSLADAPSFRKDGR